MNVAAPPVHYRREFELIDDLNLAFWIFGGGNPEVAISNPRVEDNANHDASALLINSRIISNII